MANSSPAKQLSPGFLLGRYELLLPVAKGGMAEVWAARLHGTRGFQKLVAVKTILPGAIDEARLEDMFLVEAELASRIHHPNVVATLDLGEHDGLLYLVMDWVDGESLKFLMSKAAAHGGVPLAIGVNLIGQACQGLHAAHSLRDDQGNLLGVVHRDVSPYNLLVTYSGMAKLVDFGIAKTTGLASFTVAGEVKGTLAYMAPEQVQGHAVDVRSDLFALGTLLYQITTGVHPFRGENLAETAQNICDERGPAPPSTHLPSYPAELEAVVLKALVKDPDQRFSSATELLMALEKAMPGPLEASFQVRVAEYLAQLLGRHAMVRRTALRVAQERVDQERGELSLSLSQRTVRAIAIDQSDLQSSLPTRQRISAQPLSHPPVSMSAPAPTRQSKEMLGLAAALSLVAGTLMLLIPSSSSAPHAARAESTVPVETIRPAPQNIAAPVIAPVARAAPSSAASAELEHPAEVTKRLPSEAKVPAQHRRPVAARPLPSASVTSPIAKASAATTTTSAAAPQSAAGVSTPSKYHVARALFGGRH